MTNGESVKVPVISLRPADRSDSDYIYRLLRALADELGEGEDFAAEKADVDRDLFGPEPHYKALIARLDERPAGLTTYYRTYSTYMGRPCLYVNDLIVEPWARGTRLGRIMMARLCRIAREWECCRVELKVLHDNPARAFYERIGMRASIEVPYLIKDTALEELASWDREEE
jgi:GNAT superfamily N-acetyltransferase